MNEPTPIVFEVEGFEPGITVWIRWDADLRTEHRAELEHLVYALLALPGAEEVKLKRYSCCIALADHITDANTLKVAVIAAIEEIRGDLERSFGRAIEVLDYDAAYEASVQAVRAEQAATL